jgi:hypothetical protein
MYYKPGSDLEIDYISGFVYDRRKYLEIALFFRSMLCLAAGCSTKKLSLH